MIGFANVQICSSYKAAFSHVGDLAHNSKQIGCYKPPQPLTVVDLAVLSKVLGSMYVHPARNRNPISIFMLVARAQPTVQQMKKKLQEW